MRIWRVHHVAVNAHILFLLGCMARASPCYSGRPPWLTSDKCSPAEVWYYISVRFTNFVRWNNACQMGVHLEAGQPCHLEPLFILSFCTRPLHRWEYVVEQCVAYWSGSRLCTMVGGGDIAWYRYIPVYLRALPTGTDIEKSKTLISYQ